MRDTVTVKLHVQEMPDIVERGGRFILSPEVISLVYRLDLPDPSDEGIYPLRAEIEGRARSARPTAIGMGLRNRRAIWFYRAHPDLWPDWLIQLGVEHRPR
ncbi:hypothetical protein [Streptomyces sp. NPDC006691]|uniref:hypothetical protein n=1 Tax=Streptomyces sp. NPDC006691 TaxID=3364757 RepID=UPI0036BE9078